MVPPRERGALHLDLPDADARGRLYLRQPAWHGPRPVTPGLLVVIVVVLVLAVVLLGADDNPDNWWQDYS